MRVAIADDEQTLLDQVSAVVQDAGHDVICFRNGVELETALRRETFDVVLLDWNMPGQTGLSVVEWARANLAQSPPFVLLTSRHDKGDIVRALEAGAVDYIIKPESDEVIRARVEAAGRRNSGNDEPRNVRFGIFELDRLEKSVERDGECVHLTAKEFDLLDLFFKNLDRPMSRGYLFSQIWGGNADLETRTLDMHVSRLRTKLGLRPENGFVIKTVFGFGYRMNQYHEPEEKEETGDVPIAQPQC